MRILWVGNAHWTGSGYGEQAHLFVPRLIEAGHDVAVLTNYGLYGKKMTFDGISYYPSGGNWENESLPIAAKAHDADLVIILHDAWVMHPDRWPDDLPPVAIWAPVDHSQIPPAVLGVLMQDNVWPIAMSRFGQNLMEIAKLDPAYVPHGVDMDVFRPQPELRDSVRGSLNIPRDAFVVGMVAANKGNPEVDRKSFWKTFAAFAQFAREHDDAYLYCHTQAQPQGGNGRDLDFAATLAGVPEGRLLFPPDEAWYLGIPREVVATLYQAFDVFANPAKGEGFGVPILEAQACGVPVIVSPHSAMQELCHAGWLVAGDRELDPLQKAEWFDPYIPSIHQCLEEAYTDARSPQLRAAAVEFAHGYNADRVLEEFWKPALEHVTSPRPLMPANGTSRAERRRLERAARKTPAAGNAAQQRKGVPA